MLRLGGLTVAMAAVIAACDNTEAGQIGRVGLAPTTTKLPDAQVSDVTLLRTCSSLQYSLLGVYTQVVDDPKLLDPTHEPLVQRMMTAAQATAKIFEDLTVTEGGEPWTCANTKYDSALIDPAMIADHRGLPGHRRGAGHPAERRPAARRAQPRPGLGEHLRRHVPAVHRAAERPGPARADDHRRRARRAPRRAARR